MAENGENKKSNILGELFVEFGVKGLPTMLKGLNSVSASFLLTKNAAEQFTKPIFNMGKTAGQSAADISKLSTSLGTTAKEIQKFQLYFKKYNLSESLLGDLGATADMLTKVRMGIGGIDGGFAYAMHRMGLDWTKYDGSIKSIEKMMHDVDNATKNMDPMERRVLLQSIGWNPEIAHAFQRGFNLSDALALSDEDIERLQKANEELNDAKSAINKLKNTTISKGAPLLQNSANVVTDMVTGNATKSEENNVKTGAIIGGLGGALGGAIMTGAQGAVGGATVGTIIPGVGNVAGAVIGGVGGAITGAVGGGAAGTAIGAGAGTLYAGNKRKQNGTPTGGAAPISPDFMLTPQDLIPSNVSSMVNNTINITNQNNINGTNAEAVKDSIISINENDISYSQYQISNMAGL